MSTSTVACVQGAFPLASWRDYAGLAKPKIVLMEMFTIVVAALVARGGQFDPWLLLHALGGTALVAASAGALNQWLESATDGIMPRTASRPLPAGRLSPRQVAVFAAVSGAVGGLWLATAVHATAAAIGVATWLLYAWFYTPLKSRTPFNTVVGAVAGALPVLIGWSAAGGKWGLPAATMFLIVFLWQFPHFMAIAWMYRREYAAAGLKMLSVVDPSGRRCGVQAVSAALALLPISLLPSIFQSAGSGYLVWALVLGVAQLACALSFMHRLDDLSARRLLRISLIYLPCLLAGVAAGPQL